MAIYNIKMYETFLCIFLDSYFEIVAGYHELCIHLNMQSFLVFINSLYCLRLNQLKHTTGNRLIFVLCLHVNLECGTSFLL